MKPIDLSADWQAVPGDGLAAQAVHVAGWLAERGVQSVTVAMGHHTRVLTARVTDLPGELGGLAGSCELRGGDLAVRVQETDGTRWLEWRCVE